MTHEWESTVIGGHPAWDCKNCDRTRPDLSPDDLSECDGVKKHPTIDRTINHTLTLIVSCFQRPSALRCCLACLCNQTYRNLEIIVTDNSFDPESNKICKDICKMDPRIRYRLTRALGCDYAADETVPEAKGTFVGFPSDDSIYSPFYAEKLMNLAVANDFELVYSDIIMESLTGTGILNVEPRCCLIDKTCFILRKDRFIPFPGKNPTGSCSDGNLIDELMRQGIRHGKVSAPLCFHV